MINEIGLFLTILAFCLSFFQTFIVPIAVYRNNVGLMLANRSISIIVFILIGFAFLSLTYSYVISDFSVLNVVQNSHSEKPLLYKITGVWGNHEGSMFLWVLILAFFSALVAIFGKNLPLNLSTLTLCCQSAIASAFLAFILFTSNPFARIDPPALQGNDLNPILQDIGLALHPPMLYLGYVGFSVCFSFAIAALITGRVDAAFGRWVRPWALISWVFLTGGITMGSYWAYYELGWGGYWFWDPVENASLMPWLAGTALLHSAIVLEKRAALKVWTILLAIIAFSLSLLGTFLVRSGILTSVHSFAVDPKRGIAILAILGFFIGVALLLFAIRAPNIKNSGLFQPISREGALVFNNVFLTTASATVLVGTLYPLIAEMLWDQKISVGAPFFNMTFGPLFIPLLVGVPFGTLLAWKRGDLMLAAGRLSMCFILALIAMIVSFYLSGYKEILSCVGIGLGVFVIFGSFAEVVLKSGKWGTSFKTRIARLKGLPRADWGAAFAHMGLGVTLFGIVAVATFGQERILTMKPGQSVEIAGKTIRFDGYQSLNGANYQENRMHFTMFNRDADKYIGEVTASKRTFPSQTMQTTEAGLLWRGLSQYYIAPGNYVEDNAMIVHIWSKPNVLMIWGGGFLMMLGGLLSLSDRRLRIGAPKGAKTRQKLSTALLLDEK
ncbi:heme lyase CcmF/NrfE family subunit [Bartonella sp. HY406]|uniref:heme lyase CcmF/NrfE family subunit n=1 Tax=Bartonella sp. HY406 TaxID=2979331 RepID=UPI0021C9ABD3|nr:heme lyase CcmF/NrfE family subunit [Bartonella sp. HY406]UXN04691.1 heme lyase CcmF/NrfE family subunit [Bartonella sp. HY406]